MAAKKVVAGITEVANRKGPLGYVELNVHRGCHVCTRFQSAVDRMDDKEAADVDVT
jgi:hypothetical protein